MFTLKEKTIVLNLLKFHCPQMQSGQTSSAILSIGTLMFSANTELRSDNEIRIIMDSIINVVTQLSSYESTSIIIGLARMGISWQSVKIGLGSSFDLFTTKLALHMNNMDEKMSSDVIWGLGAMAPEFNSLNFKLRSSLIKALDNILASSSLSPYSLSSIAWAVAKMSCRCSDLSPTFKKAFVNRLEGLSKDFSPQQSSKTIWAMGYLGLDKESLPLTTLVFHVVNVGRIKKSKMGGAVSASQMMTGLAKLGYSWNDMPKAMQTGLLDQLTRVCSSTNERGIVNSIWALGSIGVPMNEIPTPVKDTMIDGIYRVLNFCNPRSFCNVVWGLAKMSFCWSDLSGAFKESIGLNILRLFPDFNSMDTGILIWSLGSLDVPLDTSPSLLETVFKITQRNLDVMKPQELSKCIWGFSGAGVSWDSIPPAVQWNINVALRRVASEMSPQDVANCAYGLAMMSFDAVNPSEAALRGTHETLLTKLRQAEKGVASLGTGHEHEIEQLRIFAQYLRVMARVTDAVRIPVELLGESNSHSTSQTQSSKLQDRVVKGMINAFKKVEEKFDLGLEVSSFSGVFPIDAVVYFEGKVVAMLEVDGPHHYRHDGKLRRKDLLKERMYTKKHPDSIFHRIRWDEANRLGSETVGEELAMKILVMSKENNNYLFNSLKSIQRSLNDFFSWGLRNSQQLDR